MTCGSGKLALAVDDDADFLDMLDVLLALDGWRTVRCIDSRRAWEEARRLRPDVIIIDLHMPAVGGWQVVEQLRRDPLTASPHVIVCTAAAAEAGKYRAQAEQWGYDVLLKPFEIDDLLALLHRVKPQCQAS